MQYIHIRNLEKYHPGYKDRVLQWAKIYFNMVQGDPDCEMITDEIDWARFIKFILLELQAKKPIPLDKDYLSKKNFNLKKRPIGLTLEALHNFIVIQTEDSKECALDKEEEQEEDKEKDKDKEGRIENKKICVRVLDYFNSKTGKKYELNTTREKIIKANLNKERTEEQLKQAIDNFMLDDWEGRHKFTDLVYCIGVRSGVDNFEKWFNFESQKSDPSFLLKKERELKGKIKERKNAR
jgi:uncharacterized phage protein (TIGR02220 family)